MTIRRTRKWSFVAQEAARLAALGLSPLDISKRLDVNKSTVTRWMKTGKLARTQRVATPKPDPPPVEAHITKTPSEWAKSVRAEYNLDATDDQIVTLAESALELSLNDRLAGSRRSCASSRSFQGAGKRKCPHLRQRHHRCQRSQRGRLPGHRGVPALTRAST
jgi:hypothetical protein